MGLAQLTVLVFIRIFPTIAFTPVFGGEAASRRFRLGLGIFLAFALATTIPTWARLDSTAWAI
ncbi:MAG: flagellar biosynthetic protein FliR, partial [Phycisphaerales bacterium]|nr:flagellar biosynthetic protein FliR [Phycisphaerales bacterium]